MRGTRTILVVDDDQALREAVAEQLAHHHEFETVLAKTAQDARDIVGARRIDLILLDIGLPDMDGRELCRQLRKAKVRCPVIMLTAADGEAETVQGLDSGANDYVTKPFRFGELLARIRAQLRSHEQSEDAVFQIGQYTFRPSAKLLLDEQNKKVRLTEKETSILKYLYRAGERVVGREILLSEVWGYNSGVTTHTLETHIYRLRQKIEKDPTNARLLVTEPGGYKLVP